MPEEKCPKCEGEGSLPHQYGPDLMDVDWEECEKCEGKGTILIEAEMEKGRGE